MLIATVRQVPAQNAPAAACLDVLWPACRSAEALCAAVWLRDRGCASTTNARSCNHLAVRLNMHNMTQADIESVAYPTMAPGQLFAVFFEPQMDSAAAVIGWFAE